MRDVYTIKLVIRKTIIIVSIISAVFCIGYFSDYFFASLPDDEPEYTVQQVGNDVFLYESKDGKYYISTEISGEFESIADIEKAISDAKAKEEEYRVSDRASATEAESNFTKYKFLTDVDRLLIRLYLSKDDDAVSEPSLYAINSVIFRSLKFQVNP